MAWRRLRSGWTRRPCPKRGACRKSRRAGQAHLCPRVRACRKSRAARPQPPVLNREKTLGGGSEPGEKKLGEGGGEERVERDGKGGRGRGGGLRWRRAVSQKPQE